VQQASSTVGVCGLCLADNIGLCYSDLLPKAVVRWIRMAAGPDQKNKNPIFVTSSTSKAMNYRVAEYLLCPTCEDRLNRGGEAWTLKNSFRGGEIFPLREALVSVPPVYTLTQARIIQARSLPAIDMSKLIHFATSIFWKASAREWWALDHSTQLDFGPYNERFRRFILGEQPFPDRAALLINISGNPIPHIGAIYPYGGSRVQGTKQYRFAVPGMAFWLHLGEIPEALREACAYHSGMLCLADNLNEMYVRDMGAVISKFEAGRTVCGSS
jgi:hypothetical protein